MQPFWHLSISALHHLWESPISTLPWKATSTLLLFTKHFKAILDNNFKFYCFTFSFFNIIIELLNHFYTSIKASVSESLWLLGKCELLGVKTVPIAFDLQKKSKSLSKKVWHFRKQLKIIFFSTGFPERAEVHLGTTPVCHWSMTSFKKIHILNWRSKVRSGTFHLGLFFDFYLDSVQGKCKYLMLGQKTYSMLTGANQSAAPQSQSAGENAQLKRIQLLT